MSTFRFLQTPVGGDFHHIHAFGPTTYMTMVIELVRVDGRDESDIEAFFQHTEWDDPDEQPPLDIDIAIDLAEQVVESLKAQRDRPTSVTARRVSRGALTGIVEGDD